MYYSNGADIFSQDFKPELMQLTLFIYGIWILDVKLRNCNGPLFLFLSLQNRGQFSHLDEIIIWGGNSQLHFCERDWLVKVSILSAEQSWNPFLLLKWWLLLLFFFPAITDGRTAENNLVQTHELMLLSFLLSILAVKHHEC